MIPYLLSAPQGFVYFANTYIMLQKTAGEILGSQKVVERWVKRGRDSIFSPFLSIMENDNFLIKFKLMLTVNKRRILINKPSILYPDYQSK